MKLFVYMLREDDPFKCTASKMVRFNMARRVRKIPRDSILLDPYSKAVLCRIDKDLAGSVTALDCSWENALHLFNRELKAIRRRLPLLLAGNPVNYSKVGKLTSAEALAASCIILGYEDLAYNILNKFKWGETFLTLNHELLREYSIASTPEDILAIEKEYISPYMDTSSK